VAAHTGANASLPMLMTKKVLPQMTPQLAKASQALASDRGSTSFEGEVGCGFLRFEVFTPGDCQNASCGVAETTADRLGLWCRPGTGALTTGGMDTPLPRWNHQSEACARTTEHRGLSR
ncbi:MAG: hypothetical protein H7X95_08345, partial [Deltaproteobacteria bacterium]|nr:hypothetical protein [Deltaproteobacteria bacterium]